MARGAILVTAALAAAVSATAFAKIQSRSNWGNDKDWPEFADSQAICRRVGAQHVPVADRPIPAEKASLRNCDSEALYYGIGMKVDYAKARKCATVEAEGDDNKFYGGSMILMQIYANGYGVRRNPDLATAFSCGIDGAAVENDLRVHVLQSLKTGPAGKAFDFCDFVTSGLAQGFCATHFSRVAAVERDAKVGALVASLPPSARAIWPATKTAFDKFVKSSAYGETDLSGTARGAFVVEAEDKLRDQFLKDFQRLRGGQWPAVDVAGARDADAKLNASYRAALIWAAGKANYTTTKPDDIRKAQRVWLIYRDAFLRFAAGAAPALSRDTILARLTRLRLAQLDSLVSE